MKLLMMALVIAVFALTAAPSPDVLDFIGGQADALANSDAQRFMDAFDPKMTGWSTLKDRVESLVAGHDVESQIEVVTDDGEKDSRALSLDWVLIVREKGLANAPSQTRREVVKCTLARSGKKWKITAFEPLEFFRF